MDDNLYNVIVTKTVHFEMRVQVRGTNYNDAAIKAMKECGKIKEWKKVSGEDYSCTDMEIVEE